ncbi:hypothetical protein, partial [Desulfobacula sp.]|uniref:hypothetical protein n=1 Tax=Desulfobacula sp. TaxID=2593537 RepID=UPI0039B88E02
CNLSIALSNCKLFCSIEATTTLTHRGVEFQESPIELTIWLLENDFYAIERVCKNSIDQNSKISGSFNIFSNEFCEKGFHFPNIDQLDVSTTRVYCQGCKV